MSTRKKTDCNSTVHLKLFTSRVSFSSSSDIKNLLTLALQLRLTRRLTLIPHTFHSFFFWKSSSMWKKKKLTYPATLLAFLRVLLMAFHTTKRDTTLHANDRWVVQDGQWPHFSRSHIQPREYEELFHISSELCRMFLPFRRARMISLSLRPLM